MDLRSAIYRFVAQGKELMKRLDSYEAGTVGRVDLHILEVQLYLLGKEVSRTTKLHASSFSKKRQTRHPRAEFPPFASDQGPKAKE
jgi:hypothetical protein